MLLHVSIEWYPLTQWWQGQHRHFDFLIHNIKEDILFQTRATNSSWKYSKTCWHTNDLTTFIKNRPNMFLDNATKLHVPRITEHMAGSYTTDLHRKQCYMTHVSSWQLMWNKTPLSLLFIPTFSFSLSSEELTPQTRKIKKIVTASYLHGSEPKPTIQSG